MSKVIEGQSATATVKCHECALSVDLPLLKVSQRALCPRCGFVLTVVHKNAVVRIIVFALSALIFLSMSCIFEFISFTSNGLENKFTLLDSLTLLIQNNYFVLAVIEIVTIFFIPLVILSGLIYLSLALLQGRYPPKGKLILKFIFTLLPWSMVEIFLIGTLVSLIKILSMADIQLGLSFYAFTLFSLFMTLVVLHLDKHQFSEQLKNAERDNVNKNLIQQVSSENVSVNIAAMNTPPSHQGKQHSIQHTWALIITSIVLYVPANTLPIMTTRLFGQDEPSTILGGVILLWEMGSFPIAIVIFIASIAVPIGKILVLIWLNYSVQNQQHDLTLMRIKFYRIAEFIGRWSMIDVFVVIVLASLIQLGDTMSIYPGNATLAFSGVVIMTMLAAMSFDPKLIWSSKKSGLIT